MVTKLTQQPLLTIAEYDAKVQETDRFADVPERLSRLAFGFFGEVGSLLAALKKISRDQLGASETQVAGEEIGDALWYLVARAHAQGVDPQLLGHRAIAYLRTRFMESGCDNDDTVNFRQIDGLIALHGSGPETCRGELLGELARVSGQIVDDASRSQFALGQSSQADLFGQLLAVLGLVCASFMLKLEDVARANLDKIHGRWPGQDRAYARLFDEDFTEHEQLPREIPMEFIERSTLHGTYVVQRLHGVYVGDRLTDNSNEPDDYRFHDVFHLAYVAHLGWSPVIRALLKRKRKSNPKVDENEDGARAMIIEEGIATWIFNDAKKRGLYENVPIGKLDYGLLKQIQSMVSGYEVDACPPWQWEKAILDGFRVFRELRKLEHRGGTVIVNMVDHSLTFKPPSVVVP